MLKKYNKLWVFGDSFTTPNICVDPKDSFWGLTATGMNVSEIINCSRSANSFDSICQLVVGLQQKIDWKNDFVILGIPPLERITIFDNHKDTEFQAHRFDPASWQSELEDIACHRGLVSLQNYGSDRTMIIHSDRSWLETQTLRTVFFLTTWLDSIGANYILVNLSKDLDRNNVWGPSEFVLPYCINHPRCIIFEKTYHGINIGVNKPADSDTPDGHHGPAGNHYFFQKSLLPRLMECGLV